MNSPHAEQNRKTKNLGEYAPTKPNKKMKHPTVGQHQAWTTDIKPNSCSLNPTTGHTRIRCCLPLWRNLIKQNSKAQTEQEPAPPIGPHAPLYNNLPRNSSKQ